jgi:membrane protease YdiL (CAAX protease family)
LKVKLTHWNIRYLAIIFFVSIIFMAFHISAKGLTNNPALIMTFLFGAVSGILVLMRGQLLEAICLHIITNTVSVYMSLDKSVAFLGLPPFIVYAMITLFGGIILLKFWRFKR